MRPRSRQSAGSCRDAALCDCPFGQHTIGVCAPEYRTRLPSASDENRVVRPTADNLQALLKERLASECAHSRLCPFPRDLHIGTLVFALYPFATTVLMCRCSIHRTGRTERKNPPSLAKKTADPYTLPRTRGGEGKWAADFSNFAEKAPSCRERPASTLRTDSSDGSDQAIAPRPGNAPTGRTTNLSRLGRLACAVFAVFATNQQETE